MQQLKLNVTAANLEITNLISNAATQATSLLTLDANVGVLTTDLASLDANVGAELYTMGNYQNWTSNVTTISSALDQLAERIKNLGG
jgi:hypothetical protein